MNNIELQDFFKREFLVKQVRWLTGIFCFTFVVVIVFQLMGAAKNYNDKLDAILDLNKDEILNSIVLNDIEGLEQHLQILRNEYDLDSAAIKFGNLEIATDDENDQNHWFNDSYSKTMSNDFGTVKFRFRARYYQGILKKTLLPATFLSLGLLGLLLLVTFIVFKSQQNKIQRMLIDPLIQLVDAIKTGHLQVDESSIDEINQLVQSLKGYNKLKEQAVAAELAAQLAHDIRSPLSVLNTVKTELQLLPDDTQKRIHLSINRIEEITFNLLKKQKEGMSQVKDVKAEGLLGLIESVKTEKEIEFRNLSELLIVTLYSDEAFGLNSKIERSSFKSILSNIINNGVESLQGGPGTITLSLFSEGEANIIQISDTGAGISPELKEKIFNKGFTTKKNGNGLGLFNAKQDIEAQGGQLAFSTESGNGTTFTITLPKAEKPSTAVDFINASFYKKIVVLDDDPAFHEVWSKRLVTVKDKLEHVYSVKEMFEKYQTLSPDTLLLSDFELMDEEFDGIDTILKYRHGEHSILVTARGEERAIQSRCLSAGIKLLPKNLALHVRISLSPVIIIDDDHLVHINWANYCKRHQFGFMGHKSIDEFIAHSDRYLKDAPIYIDSSLGDGIYGEVESEKIFALGFSNLYLFTGFDKDTIKRPHWIKDIFPKGPEKVLALL